MTMAADEYGGETLNWGPIEQQKPIDILRERSRKGLVNRINTAVIAAFNTGEYHVVVPIDRHIPQEDYDMIVKELKRQGFKVNTTIMHEEDDPDLEADLQLALHWGIVENNKQIHAKW